MAGIEVVPDKNGGWKIVRKEDGNPNWIRPIANTTYGEIPTYAASGIKLLSIIKLTGVVPCPDQAHAEDVQFSRLECCPRKFPLDSKAIEQFVDSVHQSVFQTRGKAVAAMMMGGVGYSLMLIHAKDARAFIDEKREKSKCRMEFNYFGAIYDFPITDPVFLEELKNDPERFSEIPDVYLTLSLGMEYEGWHHKLVAGVLLPSMPSWSRIPETVPCLQREEPGWFDEYERKMARLLDEKENIEAQIEELRSKLMKQMESYGINNVHSPRFSVSYTPARTVMQFDSKAFRTENEELYSNYCKPKERQAIITVRRVRND